MEPPFCDSIGTPQMLGVIGGRDTVGHQTHEESASDLQRLSEKNDFRGRPILHFVFSKLFNMSKKWRGRQGALGGSGRGSGHWGRWWGVYARGIWPELLSGSPAAPPPSLPRRLILRVKKCRLREAPSQVGLLGSATRLLGSRNRAGQFG